MNSSTSGNNFDIVENIFILIDKWRCSHSLGYFYNINTYRDIWKALIHKLWCLVITISLDISANFSCVGTVAQGTVYIPSVKYDMSMTMIINLHLFQPILLAISTSSIDDITCCRLADTQKKSFYPISANATNATLGLLSFITFKVVA